MALALVYNFGLSTALAQSASPDTTAPPAVHHHRDAKNAAAAKLGNAKYKTEADAKAHCGSSPVVWAALGSSKAFHTAQSEYYGKTKHGAYVCENAAIAAGLHASKK